MPARFEDELLAELRAPSHSSVAPGALRFLLATFVPGQAPAGLAFTALQLQVALQRQSAVQCINGAVPPPPRAYTFRPFE